MQKPTRSFIKKLEVTLRNLKAKGFRLYEYARDETQLLFDKVYETNRIMAEEQRQAMIEQNDSIKERVEQRLYQVMNEVI